MSWNLRLIIQMTTRKSLTEDLKWGLTWGLWFAGGCSLLAAALFTIRGTVLGEASRFSLPLVILAYIAMGGIGGLIVGLLRPVARWRLGAAAVGIVVGVIVYFIAGLTAIGAREFLSPPGSVSALVLGTLIGGACGYNSWSPDNRT